MAKELFYMTEGTGGDLSSHKAMSAARVLEQDVNVVGVTGHEPSHISSTLDLIGEKWRVFWQTMSVDPRSGVYLAMDVATAMSPIGEEWVDVRKFEDIRANPAEGITRRQALVNRVSSGAEVYGDRDMIAMLEPAIQAGNVDVGRQTTAIATGAARGYIMLPNNPLRDRKLYDDYVTWSGLENKLYENIPGGYDIATLLAFLALNDRIADYSPDELVMLPGDYVQNISQEPGYVETGLEFFKEQGRIPDGMIEVLGPDLTVGLLDFAFNTPNVLLKALINSADNLNLNWGQTFRRNPISMRGKAPKQRLTYDI